MLSGTCSCGSLTWTFHGDPGSATACNCTICRRYGALWIYGWQGENVAVAGLSTAYTPGKRRSFHFCLQCGCLAYYQALTTDKQGRRKIAANLRMNDDIDAVARMPVYTFDGLDSSNYLDGDDRCVADTWV